MTVTQRVVQSRITVKIASGDRALVFARGRGPYVWDGDERKYIDLVCGYGPVIVGHAVEAFNERLSDYLANGLMMPGYTRFHEEYLVRLLASRPNDRGAFFKTASEAVTAAFRLAAIRTGRAGIVRSGFVGWHDAQIARTWPPMSCPGRRSAGPFGRRSLAGPGVKWNRPGCEQPRNAPRADRLRATDAGQPSAVPAAHPGAPGGGMR